MSVQEIEVSHIMPRFYLTGFGAPLLHAPDRGHIAEVGPIDPVKWMKNSSGDFWGVLPFVQCVSIWGNFWKRNPRYDLTPDNEAESIEIPTIKLAFALL